jgi:hypothetical protein
MKLLIVQFMMHFRSFPPFRSKCSSQRSDDKDFQSPSNRFSVTNFLRTSYTVKQTRMWVYKLFYQIVDIHSHKRNYGFILPKNHTKYHINYRYFHTAHSSFFFVQMLKNESYIFWIRVLTCAPKIPYWSTRFLFYLMTLRKPLLRSVCILLYSEQIVINKKQDFAAVTTVCSSIQLNWLPCQANRVIFLVHCLSPPKKKPIRWMGTFLLALKIIRT